MSCSENKNGQGENFLSNVDQNAAEIVDDSELLTFFQNKRAPISPAFQLLPAGSTTPAGWLMAMMKNDLEYGMVGALDELYPGITKDDLYFTARRGGMEDIPEMGDLVLTGAAWEKSIMWWNAETIGNWWDGYVRHAFVTNNTDAIEHSHKIVENLLASQDEDGYIGIYKNNLRYQHEGSNGELWAQTTAFRMLLGYFEITGDARVLEAVEEAMAVTMENYSEEGRNPFYLKNAFGGVTHGLMMTDVCDHLYRITGKEAYRNYGAYLYQAFSTYSINRSFNDIRYPYLIQKDSLFEGHGVHTYEHLRSILQAYHATGYPELKVAYENAMQKLDWCLLPSAAGHGNEWIAKMKADASLTSSEYCTMLELRNFYTFAFQKTGDIDYADRAEKLTFNGMMGFRNQDGTAITYGKGDNCYILDGHHHEHGVQRADPRFKYSPTHSDPAVCCVPNYTRNYSYYLDYMWHKKNEGLVASLYGPSVLKTSLNGTEIIVEQQTAYPFDDHIKFTFELENPVDFPLYLRKPGWSEDIKLSMEDATITNEGNFVIINRTWESGDELKLEFVNEIKSVPYNEERYVQKGALVFALPIPHEEKVIKEYELAGFRDYYCFPTDETYKSLALVDTKLSFEEEELDKNEDPWYAGKFKIKAGFVNTESGEATEEILLPMGSTVLRRVTF
jgi:hypothetical protein